MPHWKCNNCHHEWDGVSNADHCDWCGDIGTELEARTPLETMIGDFFDEVPECTSIFEETRIGEENQED